MKLSLIFALIDITILVAYPFVFLAGKMRQLWKIKRYCHYSNPGVWKLASNADSKLSYSIPGGPSCRQ